MINTSAPGRTRIGGCRRNGFTRARAARGHRSTTISGLLLASVLLAACPMVAQAMTDVAAGKLAYAVVKGNDSDSLLKLMKAAYAGDATAQDWLGNVYASRHDYPKANKWYRKAVKQGNADAEYNLGAAYAGGYGVQQDYAKANDWCRKAAAKGSPDAAYLLGRAYYLGLGVKPDKSKATYWMQKASALRQAWDHKLALESK